MIEIILTSYSSEISKIYSLYFFENYAKTEFSFLSKTPKLQKMNFQDNKK